jgi:hypothetical protein
MAYGPKAVKLENEPGVPVALPIVPFKLPPAVVLDKSVDAPSVITTPPKSSSASGVDTLGVLYKTDACVEMKLTDRLEGLPAQTGEAEFVAIADTPNNDWSM